MNSNTNASVAQYGGHQTPPPSLPQTGLDVGIVVLAAVVLASLGAWLRVKTRST